MRRSFSRRAQPRRWALAAARCTARLAWCACALRGGQGAWRAARGASSGLGPPFEGSLARWGVVARWGCSSRACRSLVLDLACWCLQNSDPELSAIYCGSWQFGRVSQSFLGFRRLQFLRLQLQVLRLRLRRRSGSGSGGEMSRPGPAALLTLKGRMANSAGDNSVPGTIAAAEAARAARPAASAAAPRPGVHDWGVRAASPERRRPPLAP